jgi:hypothetical protein
MTIVFLQNHDDLKNIYILVRFDQIYHTISIVDLKLMARPNGKLRPFIFHNFF